jgi:hypothetical protein
VETHWSEILKGFFCTYRLNVEYLGSSQTLAHGFFLSGSVNSQNFAAMRVPPNSASLILLLSVLIFVMNRKLFHLQRLTEFFCNILCHNACSQLTRHKIQLVTFLWMCVGEGLVKFCELKKESSFQEHPCPFCNKNWIMNTQDREKWIKRSISNGQCRDILLQ